MSSRSREEMRMLTRFSLARDAEAIAAKRAISLSPFDEGCHSPLSKEARISSSSFLSLSISTLLIKVDASSFLARGVCFREDLLLRLHKRHQIGVATNTNHKHALARILICVRMIQHDKKAAIRHGRQHLLKRYASLSFKAVIFLGTPVHRFHTENITPVCLMASSGL